MNLHESVSWQRDEQEGVGTQRRGLFVGEVRGGFTEKPGTERGEDGEYS